MYYFYKELKEALLDKFRGEEGDYVHSFLNPTIKEFNKIQHNNKCRGYLFTNGDLVIFEIDRLHNEAYIEDWLDMIKKYKKKNGDSDIPTDGIAVILNSDSGFKLSEQYSKNQNKKFHYEWSNIIEMSKKKSTAVKSIYNNFLPLDRMQTPKDAHFGAIIGNEKSITKFIDNHGEIDFNKIKTASLGEMVKLLYFCEQPNGDTSEEDIEKLKQLIKLKKQGLSI